MAMEFAINRRGLGLEVAADHFLPGRSTSRDLRRLLSFVGPPWYATFHGAAPFRQSEQAMQLITVSRDYGAGGGEVTRQTQLRSDGNYSTTSCYTGLRRLNTSLTPTRGARQASHATWPIAFDYTRPTSGTSTGLWRRLPPGDRGGKGDSRGPRRTTAWARFLTRSTCGSLPKRSRSGGWRRSRTCPLK